MKITQLYMASSVSGIMRISANGGTPESIVKRKSGNLTDPQILPDGKSVTVHVLSHDSSEDYGAVPKIGRG